MKRIWTGLEYRELHKVTRNEHGDIMFTLDGGEVWQFTPRDITVKTPRIDKVDHVSILCDKMTGMETPLAVMILNTPKRDIRGNLRKLPRDQSEIIEQAVVKAADRTFKPLVQKAVDASTPSHKREWWQNVQALYDREMDWGAVAKIVVISAKEQNQKPVRERWSDYLTALMLKRLIEKLNTPGASLLNITADYSEYLRKRVTTMTRKHKNP